MLELPFSYFGKLAAVLQCITPMQIRIGDYED